MAKELKAFRVRWEIEVDATDETDACEKALEIQRDIDSEALYFDVTELRTGDIIHVDMNS